MITYHVALDDPRSRAQDYYGVTHRLYYWEVDEERPRVVVGIRIACRVFLQHADQFTTETIRRLGKGKGPLGPITCLPCLGG